MKTFILSLAVTSFFSVGLAMASGLSGNYTVANTGSGALCAFEENAPIVIRALPTSILITENKVTPYPVGYSTNIGDFVQRPSDALIASGYRRVFRDISTYGKQRTSLTSMSYAYDVSLSDAEGLQTGFYGVVQIAKFANGNVVFSRHVDSKPTENCTFAPARN